MVADLRAESDELDELVADLPAARWAEPTPAAGWTIAHQIAHLLWTDRVALIAVTDEAGFAAVLQAAATNPTGFVDEGAEELAGTPPKQLLADWRSTRARLHDELLAVADGRKLPWFGPPMSAASMATARLMETWAHGLDVADALGVERPATARLRSIAHIGVRTRDFAFAINGLAPPAEPFHVELRRAGRFDVVVGTRGRRTTGHRLGGGLLHAGHPATAEVGAGRDCRGRGRGAVADDRAGVRRPAGPGPLTGRSSVASVHFCTPLTGVSAYRHGRSREELQLVGGVGGAVAVGVGQLHVPVPVAVGVDVGQLSAHCAVGQAIAVDVEQPVVDLPVTVEHRPSGPPKCSTPSRPNHRSCPARSTLTAQVPDPSSVK